MIGPRILIGLAVATFVATAAFHPSIEPQAAERASIIIEISGFEFKPDIATVAVGDVLIWKNLDIVPHAVTAMDDSWDSSTIEAGDEWEVVVTEDMLGTYFCRFHPSMVATLEISIE